MAFKHMAAEQARSHATDGRVVHLPPPGDGAAARGTEQAPVPRRSQRWVYFAVPLLLAALYGIGQWILGPKTPVYMVTKGAIVQTVVASGRVATPQRVSIGAQIIGTVVAVPVAEGQAVKAGQLLIQLDDTEASAAVAQARAAVKQADARLQQIREMTLPAARQALRRAEVSLNQARSQFNRIADLRAQGFVGQSQLDDARANLDIAASDVRVAKLQVQTNLPQGSDYLAAAAALEQARASIAQALARLDYTGIEAPVDGTLIARDVERGDVVQPGAVLMVLSPAGPTQLVVQIDEKNLARIRPGQTALVSADAYPNQQFTAQVAYINPAVEAQRGSVEVKLDVPAPPPYLRQDMTVSVDIEVARVMEALSLPLAAVHDASSGKPWVWAVRNGRARRQAVILGARGAGQVEVLQGLALDDVVIAVAARVREDARVRAVPMNGATLEPQ